MHIPLASDTPAVDIGIVITIGRRKTLDVWSRKVGPLVEDSWNPDRLSSSVQCAHGRPACSTA